MKKSVLLIYIVFAPFSGLLSQYPLLLNKQGNFKVIDWGLYTHYNCGFTKTETTANYQKVLALIDAVKKGNSVLSECKGFDAQIILYAQQCDPKYGYGIPGNITFGFCSWFDFKGKESVSRIEPPAWYLQFNILGQRGGYDTGKKPVTRKEQWEEASRKLGDLIRTMGEKETLAPGIDRYNGQDIVVYNPARPAYWLPITVREVYKLTFDYWKLNPDSISREYGLQILEAEYATFTEEELDGYAYVMGKGALAGVGNDTNAPQIFRPNPDYWDKKLPKSAIQILRFQCNANKEYLHNRVEEYLKALSTSYNEARFEEQLDVYQFDGLIDK